MAIAKKPANPISPAGPAISVTPREEESGASPKNPGAAFPAETSSTTAAPTGSPSEAPASPTSATSASTSAEPPGEPSHPHTFITFGQAHSALLKSGEERVFFDKDSVAVIEGYPPRVARRLAFRIFERFSFVYTEEEWIEEEQLPYYPRGYLRVPAPLLQEALQHIEIPEE